MKDTPDRFCSGSGESAQLVFMKEAPVSIHIFKQVTPAPRVDCSRALLARVTTLARASGVFNDRSYFQ
jgi:hypothetical protein